MPVRTYIALEMPSAPLAETGRVLELYRQVGTLTIPGMVVQQATLDQVGELVLGSGLVKPGLAFNNPEGRHQSEVFAGGIYDDGWHIDFLPDEERPMVLQHHQATKGMAQVTLASLTPAYAARVMGDIDGITGVTVTDHFEATLDRGWFDPQTIQPKIYRGRAGTEDVTVLRLNGLSPTVHDFTTLPEAGSRGALMRGYNWAGPTA